MTRITTPTQVAARFATISLAATLIAGCLMDGKLDSESTGEGSEQSGGGQVANSAPTIWGDPGNSVLVGANYAFQPQAEDADGDVLEFSIANKPAWASFDTTSGLLQGIPDAGDVGVAADIVISVTDSSSVVSLASFDVAVQSVVEPPPEEDPPTASAPPSISGTPNTSVVAGTAYSFRPEASDPEEDTLSFSVVNKPAWATFSTTTGRLQGTPTTAHLGTSSPIEISVTDGTSIAALQRFTITVESVGTVSKTLQWTPPTQNEDGTPLTNLAGYRIYYGTTSGDYSEVIELSSPGLTSYTIQDLAPGTYYLVMTSYTSDDLESRYTPEVSFELGT